MPRKLERDGIKMAGILFLDVRSFSTLTPHQLQRYVQHVMPEIASVIEPYRSQLIELNTWGDGLIAVSENPIALARLALSLRDYFRASNFEEKSLPNSLRARVSLHAGTVYFGRDPIRNVFGVTGANVTLAARVEPIIVPGEVWATEDFASMVSIHVRSEKLAFDDLGPRQLAKNYGSRKLLRLRREDESESLSSQTEEAIRTETKLTELNTAFDVIGIGAMNTDYIATSTALKKLKPDLIAEHELHFELGRERPATEAETRSVIDKIGGSIITKSLGGSSFNTICALAHAHADLNLGYIGVAGRSEADEGFRSALSSCRVDCSLVADSKASSGICVSYISRGERSLLTWPGANIEMKKLLQDRKADIASAIGRARVVHVTSLFDSESPRILAEMLREAKSQNPWLQISFDPGHDWVRRVKSGDNGDPIKEIMGISTYLFLNSVEFGILGSDAEIQTDLQVASDIFSYLSSQTILILLKRYNEIRVFHRLHRKIREIRFGNTPLMQQDVEDATGAGDVFAAGLFVAMLVPGLELRDGVNLGLELARQKLRHAGSTGLSTFSSIVEKFIDNTYLQRT
jgi:sugar/nucleoside kinase (ribokinase family)/class 3 adenylate cyclase